MGQRGGGMSQAQRPDIADISERLAARMESLAADLFPNGERHGSQWCVGSLAGEPGSSLSISLRGSKAGRWKDFGIIGGPSGDALDLIAQALYGGDIGRAITWACQWLGIDTTQPQRHHTRPQRPVRIVHDEPKSEALCVKLWNEAKPGHEALRAYMASRSLTLPERAPLRFHPACPHRQDRIPAMLALMTDPVSNQPVGIHRTFLKPDGSGKADVTPAKMVLGSWGVIRLTPDDEVTVGLGISEGIENAITVLQHLNWSPVWAIGNAGSLASFPVLDGIETLTIFADHDIAGINAAQSCGPKWVQAGRAVQIIAPRMQADWNDAMRGAA